MRIAHSIVWSVLIMFSGGYVHAESANEEDQKPEPATVVKKDSIPPEETTPVERGKKLHADKCVSCHTAEIYTREEHKVTHYEGLQSRVETCAVNLDLPWFDNDINDVVAYLNTDYYKFATESETDQKPNSHDTVPE